MSAFRPARALLGWLPDDHAALVLNSWQASAILSPEQQELTTAARAAAASRQPVDQAEVVAALPDSLSAHETRLRASAADMFEDGWELRLVDLSRLVAFQPFVCTDHARQRVSGVSPDDLEALGEVTLPSRTAPIALRPSFDEDRNAWVIASPNPNLRISGPFNAPISFDSHDPGKTAPGFGFTVTVAPSYLQVAELDGLVFLRDGYHRALGLLARNIRVVPAFFRGFSDLDDIVPAGMLADDVLLGPGPPVLPDYLDDAVAADVHVPGQHKVLVIQGLEIGFLD